MLSDRGAMGIDSCTSLPWSSSHRRATLTPARLRHREERKRIIRALEAKYRTIDDHERGMLRFVLIRNNLRRLQRESKEEKFARHRNNVNGSKASNLSPSCLSATRSLSPSPPPACDYGGYVTDSLSPSYGGPAYSLFGDDPPLKKQRLFFDDDNDKENEMEVDDERHSSGDEEAKSSGSPGRPVDDAQEILRDLYETCVSEGITQRTTVNTCVSDSYTQQTSLSLSMSASSCVSSSISNSTICGNSSGSSSSNSDCGSDWSRHSQYPFNCGHSSLLGNDLQSVVFHSLITSLES